MGYPNIAALLILSTATFAFNLAYNSFCSIYSQVLFTNGYNNLGFYSLAISYFFQGSFCFLVPPIDNLMNNRVVLQISVLPTIIWMFSLFLSTFHNVNSTWTVVFSMFSAALNGIGGAFMMVTMGKYLCLCVKIKEERAGLYTSIFWTLSLGSQIFSYLLNALILGYSSKQVLILVCILITIISLLMFAFLPEPVLPEDYTEYFDTFSEGFKDLLQMFKNPKIIKMYGLFINTAISSGIMCAILIPFYIDILNEKDESDQLRIAYLIMIVYGFGAMIGGQLIGLANDYWGGSKRVSQVGTFIHLVVYGTIFFCNELHSYNPICYIASFLLGVQDSALMTQISIVFSAEFIQTAQPFAILYVVKYFFMSLIILIGSFLIDKFDYRIFFCGVGIVSVLFQTTFLFTFKFRIIQNYWLEGHTEGETKKLNKGKGY